MLESIYIDNFRSIKDTTLNLQRVNLFIGPNNSGKSNFLKAIEFFGETINGNFKKDQLFANYYKKQGYALQRIPLTDFFDPIRLVLKESMEGSTDPQYCVINYLGYNDNYQSPLVNLLLGATNLLNEEGEKIYNFTGLANSVQFLGIDDLKTLFNEFYLSDNCHDPIYLSPFLPNGKSFHGNSQIILHYLKTTGAITANEIPLSVPDTNSISSVFFGTFWESYKSIKIYKPDPVKMISAFRMGSIENETILNNDVSNIIPFLETMRNKYQRIYKSIERDLEKFSHEFKSIAFETIRIGNESYRKLGLNPGDDNNYWSEELSEGVLYFLGLLCIIHQPDPPALLIIEEPEKGIHPRRIQEVMRLIFDLAYEKNIQVIITTHSTIVVDQFDGIPESVFVFEMHDEVTQVKNLKTDIIETSNKKLKANGFEAIEYTNGLGEHWAMGFLGGVPDDKN